MRFRGYKKFMWVLLVTQMFPIAVLIVPMYQILSELQLIDSYLGLVLVYCSTAVPYCAWLLKGYFDTIPFEIDRAVGGELVVYESSAEDGSRINIRRIPLRLLPS